MANNDVFAVIADKTRRGILTALKDGERPVGDLVTELGVAQPTVSKHLKILREAGMVSMEARGQRRLYAVRAEPLAEVTDWVHGVVGGAASDAEAAGGLPSPAGAAATPTGGVPAADLPATTGEEAAAATGAEDLPTAATTAEPPRETPGPVAPRPAEPGPAQPGPGEPRTEAPAGVPTARPAAGARAGGLFSGLSNLRRRARKPRR